MAAVMLPSSRTILRSNIISSSTRVLSAKRICTSTMVSNRMTLPQQPGALNTCNTVLLPTTLVPPKSMAGKSMWGPISPLGQHHPSANQLSEAIHEARKLHVNDVANIKSRQSTGVVVEDLMSTKPPSSPRPEPKILAPKPQPTAKMAAASFTNELGLGEAPRGDRKKRVIVTGGSGKLGRATVQYLSDEGWEVISVDTRRPAGISEDGKSGLNGAYRLVEIDLEDMGAVLETFISTDMAYNGIDAVVHLAAIPSPGQTNSSRQFRTNVMSTYNVLEAARKLRITNIVLASSETLIGIPLIPHSPTALPITEEELRRPESAYSLSKLVGEVISDQYVRWDPSLKVISLRFSNVMLPQEYATFEGWQNDPKLRFWNCWGYIDARDGAQAVSKSLESQMKGHHQYLIAAKDTCMRTSNQELVKAVFPDVKYTPTSGENDTLLSIEKAKKELGFDPKFDWRSEVEKLKGGK